MDRDYPARVKAGDGAVTIDREVPGARGIGGKVDEVLSNGPDHREDPAAG
jgi:hypothetical protein